MDFSVLILFINFELLQSHDITWAILYQWQLMLLQEQY